MVNGTQCAQTDHPKKLRRNGRSKTRSGRDGGSHRVACAPPGENPKQPGSCRVEPGIGDIMSLVHNYIPKIPSFCRPRRQIIPPLREAHSAQTPPQGPSARDENLSSGINNISLSELVEEPFRSISPVRWNQQLEDSFKKGFKSLRYEVCLLRNDLEEIVNQMDNLSASINILTNMQGVLVETIVGCKIKDSSAKVLVPKANNHSKIS